MLNTNPVDKNYKCMDNSPDFFKEGGLIVGSTNRINYLQNDQSKNNKNIFEKKIYSYKKLYIKYIST